MISRSALLSSLPALFRRAARRVACTCLLFAFGLASGSSQAAAQDRGEAPPADLVATPDEDLPGRQYRDLGRPPDPPIRPLRTRGLPLDMAALMYSGQQGGAVPLAVLAVPQPARAGVSRVALVIDVDPTAFAPLGAADEADAAPCQGTARVEIYVYALSDQGVLLDTMLQTFEIDMDRVDPCLAEAGARFVGELELAAGANASLRTLVRTGPDRVGLHIGALAVPATDVATDPTVDAADRAQARFERELSGIDRTLEGAAAPAVRLSPPLLSPRDDGPLTLREVRDAADRRPPTALLENPPAARPVVERGGEITLRLLATGLETLQSDWRAELRDIDGRPLAEIPARVTRYGAPAADGQRLLELAFDADGLPYGAMQLRVAMAAGDADSTEDDLRSPELQIAVIDSLEPRVVRSGGAAAAPEVNEVELKRIHEEWEPILALYAEGDESAARRQLFELCLGLAQTHGMEGLRGLGKVTLDGVAELGPTVGDAALPVALLQFELYREARRRGRTLLSTHARELMVELLRRWAKSDDGAAEAVAESYVLLGGELQRSSLVRYSSGLFSRALDLDPRQTAALLGLGMNYEYVGDAGEAQSLYGQLLDVDPGDGLARLRRAVNLERLGRDRPARRELEQLLEMRTERWIRTIAYQELARMLLDDGDTEAARELLETATDELPGEERLYLLLAFTYDATGKSREARGVLTEMALLTAATRGFSPRHRYTLWATDAQAGIHRRLRDRASPVREALSRRWVDRGAFTERESEEEAR